MDLDRRTFIKLAGVTAGGVLLPCSVGYIAHAARPEGAAGQSKGMLCDCTRCVGCGWCQRACKEANGLPGATLIPGDSQAPLSAENWTRIEFQETEQNGQMVRVFAKRQCMHCLHPACVSACPVGALHRLEDGAVVYDQSRCIGCRYCMMACPFGVPKFDWNETLPTIHKCFFCADRQAQGLEPACAAACPTGALTFGDRDALLAEAQARIQADPARYVDHIYGQNELGGTAWLYLSPIPFEQLGFPTLKTKPVTTLSESVATYGTAGMAVGVAAVLAGIYSRFGKRQPGMTPEGTPEESPPDQEGGEVR
jgi:formate dehydrogenase iron-sulfur subunit